MPPPHRAAALWPTTSPVSTSRKSPGGMAYTAARSALPSGVAYANEGKIKKVAISTYIITPYNVDILGDLIDELENNGLYF